MECNAPTIIRQCNECPYRKGYSLCRLLDKLHIVDCPNFNTVYTAQIYSIIPQARIIGTLVTKHETNGEVVREDNGEVVRKNVLSNQNLESYIVTYGEIEPNIDVAEYKNKLTNLVSGNLFPSAYKVGQSVSLISRDIDFSKLSTTYGRIVAINNYVKVNEETQEPQDKCQIHMVVDGKQYHTYAENLGDYFLLADGINIEGVVEGRSVLSCTPEGYLKPVHIIYGKEEIIIDNSYIYLKNKDVTVIGAWKHNKAIMRTPIEEVVSTRLAKFVNKTLETTSIFKDDMLPYWLIPAHTVQLSK